MQKKTEKNKQTPFIRHAAILFGASRQKEALQEAVETYFFSQPWEGVGPLRRPARARPTIRAIPTTEVKPYCDTMVATLATSTTQSRRNLKHVLQQTKVRPHGGGKANTGMNTRGE